MFIIYIYINNVHVGLLVYLVKKACSLICYRLFFLLLFCENRLYLPHKSLHASSLNNIPKWVFISCFYVDIKKFVTCCNLQYIYVYHLYVDIFFNLYCIGQSKFESTLISIQWTI